MSSSTGYLKLFLPEAVYTIVLTFIPLSSTWLVNRYFYKIEYKLYNSKTGIEEIFSFSTVLFTVLFYHIKNTRHIKKQLLTMVA